MKQATHNISHLIQRERGFSLVEMMVAIVISLVLMAGVSQIFLSSKTSYNLQDGMGRLQENARFALDIMHRSISMAGYTPSGTAVLTAFDSANSAENATANADLGFSVSDNNASDTIAVRYSATADCLGNATGGTVVDRFYLNGDDLMCLGSGSVTPGVIAEGVENLQILYGEDTDTDKSANLYVDASNVTNWNDVVSVRIAMLVSTVQTVGNATTDSKTYVLLNTPAIGPIGDHVIRRAFTRTILLRNKLL